MITAALLGVGIGLLVAAQVGPVWLLCARSATRYGFGAGAMIGIGVAGVDLLYAALAALGVGTLLGDPTTRAAFGLLGSAVLAWYAARTLRSAWLIRQGLEEPWQIIAPREALRTGIIATASNPLTIISWAAVFSGATVVASVPGTAGAVALLLGIAAGSLGWHLGLSAVFGTLGTRIGANGLTTVDVLAGVGLGGFAAALAAGSASSLRSGWGQA